MNTEAGWIVIAVFFCYAAASLGCARFQQMGKPYPAIRALLIFSALFTFLAFANHLLLGTP